MIASTGAEGMDGCPGIPGHPESHQSTAMYLVSVNSSMPS